MSEQITLYSGGYSGVDRMNVERGNVSKQERLSDVACREACLRFLKGSLFEGRALRGKIRNIDTCGCP